MNRNLMNLNRIEFIITYDCTGRCRHCSEGDHPFTGIHLDAQTAEKAVYDISQNYSINSVMTFGGEPLMYPETVCAIHSAASVMRIPHRQLITNGCFSNDIYRIKQVAEMLRESGVNDILLSADAFHQETIPEETVKAFASEIRDMNVRLNPAWLVSRVHDNPYNKRTREIIKEFMGLGIKEGEGNIVFPEGNAAKKLAEYFDKDKKYINPYEENPADLKTISIEPDGSLLGRNIRKESIKKILDDYKP